MICCFALVFEELELEESSLSKLIRDMTACCHPKFGKWHIGIVFSILLAACVLLYLGAFFWSSGDALLISAAHTTIATTVFSLLSILPDRIPKKLKYHKREWSPRLKWQVFLGGVFVISAAVLLAVGIPIGSAAASALGINFAASVIVWLCVLLIIYAMDELPRSRSRTPSQSRAECMEEEKKAEAPAKKEEGPEENKQERPEKKNDSPSKSRSVRFHDAALEEV